MKIPKNQYKLTEADLEQVKDALVRIATSEEMDPKDRVAAAKEIRGMVDQIQKYRHPEETKSRPVEKEETRQDIFKGMKVVG